MVEIARPWLWSRVTTCAAWLQVDGGRDQESIDRYKQAAKM